MEDYILEKLKNSRTYVSGEELSRSLGVSRTAVWKHINDLKKAGYNIESSSKKGYRLVGVPDLLDAREVIIPEQQQIGRELIHFDEIDSTNNYAKKIAGNGCAHGTVIVAEKQTFGRGRIGRNWESTNNKGLWFSIVLRPELEPERIQIITLAASVAVVEAILETQGIVCGIKWPNDIILDGKKLGGILTELSAEPGHVNYIVVGIGININQDEDEFDAELRNKATSVKIHTGSLASRVRLLESILTKFEHIYNSLLKGNSEEIIYKWSKHSITLGKEVRVAFRNTEYIGFAQEITPEGKLVVKCIDGEIREITAGEIQVRGVLGYID